MSRQWRSDDTSKWLYGFGDGSDGDLTISADTTEAPIDSSCSGTSGTTSLTATNASFSPGQIILIHQTRGTGAGGWELNKIDSYTAGTITLKHALTMTYTDSGASQAQVRVLKQYNNVVINSTKTYTAKAWNGDVGGILGWFAKTGTTVTGTLNLTGKGFVGGTAGGVASQGYTGEGTANASIAQNGANGNGGGGGLGDTGNRRPGGGGGGHATTGTSGGANNGNPGGVGGASVGGASLVSSNLGGGGGKAGAVTGRAPGSGGTGGGFYFIASKDITITGSIANNGSAGGNNGSIDAGGGGGGAGGSSLLKCATATLGTNKITVAGGGGGSGDQGTNGGGAGSVGRIHIDYSTSYTGTTSPTIDATQDSTIIPASGSNFTYIM